MQFNHSFKHPVFPESLVLGLWYQTYQLQRVTTQTAGFGIFYQLRISVVVSN